MLKLKHKILKLALKNLEKTFKVFKKLEKILKMCIKPKKNF